MLRSILRVSASLLAVSSLIVSATPLPTANVHDYEKRAISQSLIDEFEWYVKYASGAYQLFCPVPNGKTLVSQFSVSSTDTQGYVARDDSRKEIIVAFRGSIQLQDFLTDIELWFSDYTSPGVSSSLVGGVEVHHGFLTAYNSVASIVISTVKAQLALHPSYSLVSLGHSLGAALASLGGISLAQNFPGTPLRVYTFGQPRTGNPAYADLAESLIGVDNIFRTTETYDGVPTIPPTWLGYRHHGTEYWVSKDPNTNAANVVKCTGQEDPTCSDSIPSTGINDAHLRYFGQVIALNPLVCLAL